MLLMGCNMMYLSPCFGQETFVYKGLIVDSVTQKGLSNVRIYVDNNLAAVKSDVAGVFRITVRKGAHVRFRKTGYTWKNKVITGNDDGKIAMSPSSPKKGIHGHVSKIEVDGKLLPEEEWNDINNEYIRDLAASKTDKEKIRLIIKTK